MIDSHTHLHLCEPSNAQLVEAAAAVGVTRMLTVGIDGASCRAALAAAEDFPQVYAAIGRHPNVAKGFDDADLAELQALAAHPRCVAIGETGLDFYRDSAPPRADQQRAFAAQIALARDSHARGGARNARPAGRRSGRRERGDALLLHARAPR
jgi:TatD DNase family protein